MAKLDNQLARMQSLMTYGTVTENKNVVSKNFETRMLGADGKSYAIIRENSKYYIKTAPKDREAVLEAYDYIGGWANRKKHEYSSYSNALKDFTLELRELNESYGRNVAIETLDPFKKEDLVIEGTEEMKNQIARMRQIMHNTAAILNENCCGIGETPIKNQPESKHKNSGDPDAPFTEKAEYEENRDGKKTSRKEIDKDNTKANPDNGEKNTKHNGKEGTEGYIKVASDIEGKDIATEKTGGYKQPKNLSEGCCCPNAKAENGVVSDCMDNWGIEDHGQGVMTTDEADMDEIDINECDEWGSCGLGKTGVGEVGDSDPFVDAVNEECEECGLPMEGCNEEDEELSDDEEFEEEPIDGESEEDYELSDDEEPMGDEEDDELSDETEEDADADFADEEEFGDDEGFEDYDDEDETIDEEDPEAVRTEIERLQGVLADLEGDEEPIGDEPEEDIDEEPLEDEEPIDDEEEMMQEAKAHIMNAIVENAVRTLKQESAKAQKARFMEGIINRAMEILKEDTTVLHDFGKHPGYRKKPFTTPETGMDKTKHGEDWNDESVYSEQPFGQKIGSSAPFDEKVVKMITDAVINEIKKKSK